MSLGESAAVLTTDRQRTTAPEVSGDGWFVRAGMSLADWCERWLPDAFVFALLYFFVNSILVLFLVWFFARTIAYVPPIL